MNDFTKKIIVMLIKVLISLCEYFFKEDFNNDGEIK